MGLGGGRGMGWGFDEYFIVVFLYKRYLKEVFPFLKDGKQRRNFFMNNVEPHFSKIRLHV